MSMTISIHVVVGGRCAYDPLAAFTDLHEAIVYAKAQPQVLEHAWTEDTPYQGLTHMWRSHGDVVGIMTVPLTFHTPKLGDPEATRLDVLRLKHAHTDGERSAVAAAAERIRTASGRSFAQGKDSEAHAFRLAVDEILAMMPSCNARLVDLRQRIEEIHALPPNQEKRDETP